jgi:hypothetical protein
MVMRKVLILVLLAPMAPTFSGCWYAAAAGAGAYVGYKAKDEGYTTQSPITKQNQQKQEEKTEN